MWCCTTVQVVADTSNEHSAFILKGKMDQAELRQFFLVHLMQHHIPEERNPQLHHRAFPKLTIW